MQEEERTCGVFACPVIGIDVAIFLQGFLPAVLLKAHGDVAFAIGKVGTHDCGQTVFLAITGVGFAVLAVQFKALEIVAQDEVGNTADGISTVYRRSATGNGFHTLDQRGRNAVDVSHHQWVDWHRAMSIYQYQTAVGAEAAQ